MIFKRINDILLKIVKSLLLVLLAGIIVAMFLQDLLRYLFTAPLDWPEGLSKVLFVLISFLAGGFLIRTRGHILIDMFVSKFPIILQNILKYIISFTTLFIILLFFISSLDLIRKTEAYIYELGMISEKWVWLAVTISAFFMLIETIFVLYEDIYNQFYKKEIPSEIKSN